MAGVIRCREAVRYLWEFLDDELDEHEHRAVEAHLAYCMRCCGELAFARELRRQLEKKTAAGPPPEVLRRLDAFIDGLGEETGRQPHE